MIRSVFDKFLYLFIVVLVSACSSAETSQKSHAELVLVGGTVIDGNGGTPKTNAAILIADGKILSVEPVADIDYTILADRVVDVSGKYLVPGFVDSHTHIDHVNGVNLTDEQKALARDYNLRAFLYNGVTTVVNMSTRHPEWLLKQKELAKEDPFSGPRIFTGGNHFTQPGGWGGRHGGGLSDPTQIQARLLQDKQDGFDLVKIIYEDGLGKEPVFDRLADNTVENISSQARTMGFPVFIHATDLAEYQEAIDSSPMAIAHGLVENLNTTKALGEKLVDKNIFVVATIVLFESFYRYVDKPSLLDNPYLKASVPDFVLDSIAEQEAVADSLAKVDAILKMDSATWGRSALSNLTKNTKGFFNDGVKIAVGSDSGGAVIHAFQGFNTVREMEILADCCMSNSQVLTAATKTAAQMLDKEELFGTLEAGKAADILIINQNPLEEISHVRDFQSMVVRGAYTNREKFSYSNFINEVSQENHHEH
ncbi:amidohydrolase family protein [Aestuariicella hydrocarbonica]|uniref:Amidohydrolase family protein n=1 Tax=Pseudomaricurvus hydrocarbonicus TaxID=1470433 RepID=A0A9E5MQP0_9GAMM|nr:amidohydrolase family protein [Aestuariicella hydrocarbonica]NHO68558.1 amidohydrolase family protein [Aestuariicella hydrocarbonica]